jgi:hypothetical protein
MYNAYNRLPWVRVPPGALQFINFRPPYAFLLVPIVLVLPSPVMMVYSVKRCTLIPTCNSEER